MILILVAREVAILMVAVLALVLAIRATAIRMVAVPTRVPAIKGTNRKIIALFFAGIPDPVVQILMRRGSLGSLRTLRTRFRQTIKEANAPDESLFIDMLEIEKQPGKNQKK